MDPRPPRTPSAWSWKTPASTTALSHFRDRLAESDRADRLLGLALTRIRRAGLLKGRAARAVHHLHKR
ncbi:hypothetical protein ACIQZO_31010 [Streptomyces sp. NPDC097617]|uniref:hypothetical protein n=1 Tax=Streptomyces sp. NPDC097617 TaxID=3366091 RepID=UPI00382053EF